MGNGSSNVPVLHNFNCLSSSRRNDRRQGGGAATAGRRNKNNKTPSPHNDVASTSRLPNNAVKEPLVNQEAESVFSFGPMVFRRPNTKLALLLQSANASSSSVPQIQKVLSERGFQCATVTVSDERELQHYLAHEHFESLPVLIIVHCFSSTKHKFNVEDVENILKTLNEHFQGEKTTAVYLLYDKLPSTQQVNRFLRNGATKVLIYGVRNSFNEELQWFENALLPLLLRLRLTPALFCSLDCCSNPVQITDSSNYIQYVNNAYENCTGLTRRNILNTKFLPDIGHMHENGVTSSSDDVADPAPSTSTEEVKNMSTTLSDRKTSPPPATKSNKSLTWNVVPVLRNDVCCQHVYIGENSNQQVPASVSQRIPSFRNQTLTIESPVSQTLALLKEAYSKCDTDEAKLSLEKVIDNLNYAQIFSPLASRIVNDDDRIACNLLGGLILNSPLPPTKNYNNQVRKRSLYDIMKNEWTTRRMNSLSSEPLTQEAQNVLEQEATWKFDVLELERLTSFRPLVHLALKIFERFHVCETLNCTEDRLVAWLRVIENHYHPQNPYHNATHASDVLQAAAFYLKSDVISNILYPTDAASVLIAAVIHDVDHPGRGSSFLINSVHSLAMLYNDVSVLENHHASLAFQLTLGKQEMNIFEKLPRAEYVAMRRSVVDMVLATDMFRHYDYLEQFQKGVLTNFVSEHESLLADQQTRRVERRRITVLRMLIKCADVSNPTRPWALCHEWGRRIVNEYFAQCEDEKQKGLPISMEVFQDKRTCNIAETQCKFIDMFAKPMFNSWCGYGKMPALHNYLEKNYEKWLDESRRFVVPSRADDEHNLAEPEASETDTNTTADIEIDVH